MKVSLNTALYTPIALKNNKKLAFGDIVVTPQNPQQVKDIAQIAYKTKEIAGKRLGEEEDITIRANVTPQQTTFSMPPNMAGDNSVESLLQAFFRENGIPYKKV